MRLSTHGMAVFIMRLNGSRQAPDHNVKAGMLVTENQLPCYRREASACLPARPGLAASYVHISSPEKHPGVQMGQLCLFS